MCAAHFTENSFQNLRELNAGYAQKLFLKWSSSHFVGTICCLWITTGKYVLLFVVAFSVKSSNYKFYAVAMM